MSDAGLSIRTADARVRIVADQLRRPVPGGIGTYVTGLMDGLHQLGRRDVSLWASRAGKVDPLARWGYPVVNSVLPSQVLSRFWAWGLNGDSPSDVDIVHATSFLFPPTAIPMTMMVHDTAWRDFPDAYPVHGREWHEAALKRAIDKVTHFLTPSPSTVEVLRTEGVSAERISLVDEGVDHLAAPDSDAARALLRSMGVHGEFLLAVGTLEPRKNLRRLVEAYSSCRAELRNDKSLVIVGPIGWGEQLPPTEGVVMAGKVSDAVLSALYSACHFFVSVPLSEGYGLPAVEAMSMGAAVISTDVPSVGDAALRVSPTDVAGIASSLVRMDTDEALRRDYQRRGRKRAAQLTWATVAQQHIAIWKQLHGR